jgi:hypothetical protein
MRSRIVTVNDKMQQGYRYEAAAPAGRAFDPRFRPDLTPKQMLELGVFCGKYLTDCRDELPASWFTRARLSLSGRDCSLNYFGVDASQPLSEWRRKGWNIRTIRAAGSSGIAATTWAGGCPRRTPARSVAGRRCSATSRKSGNIASRATRPAGGASAKRSCTGRMTAGEFRGRIVSSYALTLGTYARTCGCSGFVIFGRRLLSSARSIVCPNFTPVSVGDK